MTIDQKISDFLRDGQYRIALLSVEMDDIQDNGSYQFQLALKRRRMISAFMDILYVGLWPIADSGYNHIDYEEGQNGLKKTWTQSEVLAEMEYIRYYTRMTEAPYITFTGHYPQIAGATSGGGNSGADLPSGLYRQFLMYNSSNDVIAVNIDPWAGPFENESINSYFSTRL